MGCLKYLDGSCLSLAGSEMAKQRYTNRGALYTHVYMYLEGVCDEEHVKG